MKRIHWLRSLAWLVIVLLTVPVQTIAQSQQQAAPQPSAPTFRPEQLDQMLAPIALYPDPLLAQVLTASTYPLEIVQADRFAKQNKGLKGDQLLHAAKDKDWDPSVKAMLQFPEVLSMMSEKLDWTQNLGDAFLAQQRDVMDAVQRLRVKAYESGNLKSTKEQVVKVDTAYQLTQPQGQVAQPAPQQVQVVQPPPQVIVIQPANPQVVYVPAYNPTVVYGVWAYPAYPPYPYYPPGYVAGAAAFSFVAGVAVGSAWGAWGCGWHHGDVNVNVNRYNSFTQNNYVNAQKYQVNNNIKNSTWQHNPEHRKGAQYRDPTTAQRYGQQRAGAATRPATGGFKGYDGSGAGRGAAQPKTSDLRASGGGQAGAGGRDVAKPQASNMSRGTRENAFSAQGGGGGERAASLRGQASRNSAPAASGVSRGSTSGGSAARSGGGTAKSGGAARGGRR